jgi:hypothetical protein
MLKKILVILLFAGAATHCPAQPIHTDYVFSKKELNGAKNLVNHFIQHGYSPKEIATLIAQSTIQEDTIKLVAPSKISKDVIICFAIGAGVGVAAMALIYGTLYTGACLKDKKETALALQLQKKETDRLEKENKELEEKKKIEAMKSEEEKQKLVQQELDRLATKEHQKPLVEKLQDTNIASEINKELEKKIAAQIENLKKQLTIAKKEEDTADSALQTAQNSRKKNKQKKIPKLVQQKNDKTKKRESLEAQLKELSE